MKGDNQFMNLSYSVSVIKNDFSNLSPDDTWSFKNIKRSETNYITHGYHRYPAKFIPQIVNRLISEFTSEGEFIFDPFGGCGTTLVEAKTLGRKSIGLDINPVAKLITETKITPLNPKLLDNYLNKFITDFDPLKIKDGIMTHSERTNYWFEPGVQKELDSLYCAINGISNHRIRRFYLCAFSHILKNCSKWLMKSIKPQIDPDKIPPDVMTTFLGHVKHMMSKNREFYELLETTGNLNTPAKMKLSDSTKKFPLKDNSIDLIITSPPYVTSYEYADLHQLTLFWLGDDLSNFPAWAKFVNNFNNFRSKFMGTQFNKNRYIYSQSSSTALDILEQLRVKKREMVNSVSKYFLDMEKSFVEMYRVLNIKKHACIIIGNTEIASVNIKNAEVAAEQMKNVGFIIKRFIKRDVTNKMITPWRNKVTGKFTNKEDKNSKRIYNYEFVIIGQKL